MSKDRLGNEIPATVSGQTAPATSPPVAPPAPKSSGEKPKERPSGGGRSKSSLGG